MSKRPKIKNHRNFQEKGNQINTPTSKKTYSPEQQPPIFSLKYLKGYYCLTNCQKHEQAAFANQLHTLSQKTWAELKATHRHGIGFEKINPTSIKATLPPEVTPDVNLIAFRFYKKAPMVGYRDGATFYVLFLDRDFSLYNHRN